MFKQTITLWPGNPLSKESELEVLHSDSSRSSRNTVHLVRDSKKKLFYVWVIIHADVALYYIAEASMIDRLQDFNFRSMGNLLQDNTFFSCLTGRKIDPATDCLTGCPKPQLDIGIVQCWRNQGHSGAPSDEYIKLSIKAESEREKRIKKLYPEKDSRKLTKELKARNQRLEDHLYRQQVARSVSREIIDEETDRRIAHS